MERNPILYPIYFFIMAIFFTYIVIKKDSIFWEGKKVQNLIEIFGEKGVRGFYGVMAIVSFLGGTYSVYDKLLR